MTPELGIIEGYFGRPWQWSDRAQNVRELASHGYGFYLYAPKADESLRRNWQAPLPEPLHDALTTLGSVCADAGVRFGVGLTPFAAHQDFGDDARAALRDKLVALDATGIGELALLFDDMDGGPDDLARRQAEIVDFAASHTRAGRLSVCPSYYSDDPLLDQAFGQRPPRYLENLAAGLDPSIGMFWTGEEVCAREISTGHLEQIAERIGRLPTLWDNYPVNDGPLMSQHLHLRGFTGRTAANAAHIRAHAINPCSQPTLNRIAALTLAELYRDGEHYCYGAATDRALLAVLGPALAQQVRYDLKYLQDIGLDRLSGPERSALRSRYLAFEHPGASEIVDWLDDGYRITGEMVRTQ